ncbi:uncharacterized protein HD556DRAFT_1306413 [Suillus plorans]|uniref:Uncharacterized protein n=1 Tax=Suillus plorans TaxID=116603 RepID=A0A9P7IZM1_9AGAM|nr:uncharacterized protein HD556DRAFT_1306413 [Suillus plorans]KAG1797821.1 hypothetical protein HD556DRAFT_1306413 [Suillus plorans]
MVTTHPSNKSKHPGKVDLPVSRQQNTEHSDDKDKEDDIRDCQLPRKKAATKKYQKAKKAAATEAIAQLELAMTEKDGQDLLQANRPSTSKVSKVPRKLSVSALSDPADETIIEDVMLIDTDQNNEHGVQNSDSPAGSNKPGAKLTKAQKVHKNIEAAKERAMEQQKGRAENEEDVVVVDSDVDNVKGIRRKRQKGRSCTCSKDGEPSSKKLKQDDLLFSSQPPQSGMINNWHQVVFVQVPNHSQKPGAAPKSAQGGTGGLEDELDNNEQLEAPGPDKGEQDPLLTPLMVQIIMNPPSNKAAQATSTATSTRPTPNEPPLCPPLDDEDIHNGEEQDDGACLESESPRPYMWKFKVVGHTITRPTPKPQGSATNSMQPVLSKTGSGKSNAGDKPRSKDRGYGSNMDREHHNNRATGRQRQQGKCNPPSRKSKHNSNKYNTEDDSSHRNFDALVVPMRIDFISTLDNMWDISDFTDEMQTIWDLALPNIKHTVSKLKDLVYKILMQCAYNYCSDFGECAKIIIAKYIEEQGWTSDEIQQVVAYIVPEQIPWVNEKGQKVFINPPIYPYMWKECRGDEKDPDASTTIYTESLTDVIDRIIMELSKINASSIHLHSISSMGTASRLNTIRQFTEGLWSYSTELIMESIDGATRRKWKKIFKGAAPFIDAHRKQPTRHTQTCYSDSIEDSVQLYRQIISTEQIQLGT